MQSAFNFTEIKNSWKYKSLLTIGIALLLLILAGKLFLQGLSVTFDDAYMFVRYAKHFLEGYGVAWNPGGPQSYGVTSFFYFIVVTIAHLTLPLGDEALLYVLPIFFGFAALLVIAWTSSRFCKSETLQKTFPLWLLFTLFIAAQTPHFLFHCTTGMDTNLSLLLNSLMIFMTLQAGEKANLKSLSLLIIISYLCVATRPDCAIYAGLFPPLYFWHKQKTKSLKNIIIYYIGFSLLIGFDTLGKYLIFGDPLPLPYYAKKMGYFDTFIIYRTWSPVRFIKQFLFVSLPTLILIIAFCRRQATGLLFAFMLPVVLTFSYLLTFVHIMGYYTRLFFTGLPFFIILSVLLFDNYLQNSNYKELRSTLIPRTCALLVLTFMLSPLSTSAWNSFETLIIPGVFDDISDEEEQLARRTDWRNSVQKVTDIIAGNSPEVTYAMTEHGHIGAAFPEVTIFDMVGLHDPLYSKKGFDADDFFNRHPDFIWLPEPMYVSLKEKVLNHPSFKENYLVFPAIAQSGVAIRKSGKHFEELKAELESEG